MRQKIVAQQHGLDFSAFNKVLNGKTNPSNMVVGTAAKIAKLLDMTIEDFLSSSPGQLKARYFELHEFNEVDNG